MKNIIVILNLFLLLFIANADEVRLTGNVDSTTDIVKLSIEDSVNLALKNNLDIETEKLKLEKKKWATVTCWNVLIPTTSLSVAFTRLNDDARNQTVSGLSPDTTSYNPATGTFDRVKTYSSDFTLPDWGIGFNFSLQWRFTATLFLGIYQTLLDYNNGKISLETAKRKLVKDIKKTYEDLVLKEKQIQLKKDELVAAEKRFKQAQVSYKNGLIPEYQMLSAQVSFENLKPNLIEYLNAYEIAIIQFKQTLGINDNVKISLIDNQIESEKKDFNYKELINKHLSKRLDFQSFDLSFKQKVNMRNIAISSLTPSFILSYSIDPTFQYDLTKYDDWKDKEITELWKQRSGVLLFSFSLPLNAYFPFSSEQMKIANANYDIKMSLIDKENKIKDAEVEIQQLVLKLDKSKKQIEFLKLNVELAQKSYKLAEEAYKAGTRELLDVEDAQNKLNSAKFNLLREEYNYTITLLDLDYALEVGSASSMGFGGSIDMSAYSGMDASMMGMY